MNVFSKDTGPDDTTLNAAESLLLISSLSVLLATLVIVVQTI